MTAVPFLARRLVVAPLVLCFEAAIVPMSPLLGLIAALARRWSRDRARRAWSRSPPTTRSATSPARPPAVGCGWPPASGAAWLAADGPRALRLVRWFVAGSIAR